MTWAFYFRWLHTAPAPSPFYSLPPSLPPSHPPTHPRCSLQLVEHVLDLEALPDLVVNPSYSPELGELREEMDGIKGEVDELHEEARDGWCDFGDKVSPRCCSYFFLISGPLLSENFFFQKLQVCDGCFLLEFFHLPEFPDFFFSQNNVKFQKKNWPSAEYHIL